jgi:hypothetical protein
MGRLLKSKQLGFRRREFLVAEDSGFFHLRQLLQLGHGIRAHPSSRWGGRRRWRSRGGHLLCLHSCHLLLHLLHLHLLLLRQLLRIIGRLLGVRCAS